MSDVPQASPQVIAAFDQVHMETNRNLDMMIEAHREFVTDDSSRIFSIMSIINQADRAPYGAHRLLAIAVDRLARMSDD